MWKSMVEGEVMRRLLTRGIPPVKHFIEEILYFVKHVVLNARAVSPESLVSPAPPAPPANQPAHIPAQEPYRTGNEGQRMKESRFINSSLFAIRSVVLALKENKTLKENKALKENKTEVPYRNSTITKLLVDCLGGSACALAVICCAPETENLQPTHSTLEFARDCCFIQNNIEINKTKKKPQAAAIAAEEQAKSIELYNLKRDIEKKDRQLERLRKDFDEAEARYRRDEASRDEKILELETRQETEKEKYRMRFQKENDCNVAYFNDKIDMMKVQNDAVVGEMNKKIEALEATVAKMTKELEIQRAAGAKMTEELGIEHAAVADLTLQLDCERSAHFAFRASVADSYAKVSEREHELALKAQLAEAEAANANRMREAILQRDILHERELEAVRLEKAAIAAELESLRPAPLASAVADAPPQATESMPIAAPFLGAENVPRVSAPPAFRKPDLGRFSVDITPRRPKMRPPAVKRASEGHKPAPPDASNKRKREAAKVDSPFRPKFSTVDMIAEYMSVGTAPAVPPAPTVRVAAQRSKKAGQTRPVLLDPLVENTESLPAPAQQKPTTLAGAARVSLPTDSAPSISQPQAALLPPAGEQNLATGKFSIWTSKAAAPVDAAARARTFAAPAPAFAAQEAVSKPKTSGGFGSWAGPTLKNKTGSRPSIEMKPLEKPAQEVTLDEPAPKKKRKLRAKKAEEVE
ncbi:hypothetical protein BDK51DRAFT_34977 [Blyttiomyces helicus]|uniref:Kinesin motor domain-containing protein n=1 Tax=Blyttiomyces helicus TaxID=388810 RepID=A0A4P9WD63_9FUNG|nr:hypothetical protein BDK51DRAFT_34977 [Blyttiomyces helicus]|eukprot:RKO89635.1 hypothetical protein BDK51DRAFT_34977 [Blyttiomyces helicus]